MNEDEQMTCPVCDSEISVESEKCPICGIEIELFRVDESEDTSEGPSVEDEDISSDVIVFECPLCHVDVAEDAKKCPNCGAIFEDDEEQEEEFNNKIAEAKQRLAEARDTKLGINYLKELLKEAVTAGKNEDYTKGIQKADECINSALKVIDIYEMMDFAKTQIEEIKEIGMDHIIHLKNLKEVKEKIDAGDYDEALVLLEQAHMQIEENLTEIESTEHIVDSPELELEFEGKFEEAKKVLFEIRDIDIDISGSKKLMKKARKAKNEGDVQTAMEHLDDLIETCQYISIISEIIEEGRGMVQELKHKGLEYISHLENLKKGKNMAEEGKHIESVDLLNSTLDALEKSLSVKPVTDDLDKGELYDDMLDVAMDLLMKIRKTHIAFDDIENLIDRASELEKKGKVDNAIKILEKSVNKAEKLLLIREHIDNGKTKIKELKKYGKADRKYLEALKEGKIMADNGDYDKAIETIKKTIEKMDMVLSDSQEIIVERKKKPSVTDIEDMVSELKDLLITAKKYGIKVDGGREIISEALESVTEKNFENTLELLDKGKDEITDYLKDVIDERMVSLEIAMGEINKQDIETVKRYLRETKKSLEKDNLSDALEYLSKANSIREVSEEPMGEAESYVAYIGKLIFDAEMLGIDVTDANELLDKAKLEIEVGDWESAEEFANDASEIIFENVPERLKVMVNKAQKELKKAKIRGMNVSEEIDILKRASMAKDDGDMERCIILMKRYKERMESMKNK